MNKLDCEIVKDLLPLYKDKAVSDKTAESIEEHFLTCEECKSEFETLNAALPEMEETTDTAVHFKKLVKKQKAKLVIKALLAFVAIFVTFWGGYKFLTEATIVDLPQYEFDFIRIFRYNAGQGDKFFIIYQSPTYWAHYVTRTLSGKGGENGELYRLEISMQKTILGDYIVEGDEVKLWVIDAEDLYGKDYKELWFGDRLIWSELMNGNDEVPEYVYTYDEFSRQHEQGYYWEINYEEGFVGAGLDGEEKTYWNFDGEEIENPKEQ